MKAAKIFPLKFHSLRHACSSRLKRQGVYEMDIQELLGHKSMLMLRSQIHSRTEEMLGDVSLLASTSLNQATSQRRSGSVAYPN